MFRRFDIRIFLILFLNAAYVYMLSVLNTEIAPAAYIVLPAIFIIPAALFLNFVQMLAAVVFSALLCEATTPLWPGATVVLWIIGAFAVHSMRFRFRACDWLSLTTLAEILNIIIVFFYALFFFREAENLFEYAVRVSTDALVSASVLLFAGKFSVSLAVSAANIFGMKMSISEED